MMNRVKMYLMASASVLTLVALSGCESKAPEGSSREEAIAAAQTGSTHGATADEPTERTDRADVAAECRVDVAVEGMVCEHGCPPTVLEALESVDGVAKVSLDFPTKHAAVDAGGTVCSQDGSQQLVDALRGVEFDGRIEGITALQGEGG